MDSKVTNAWMMQEHPQKTDSAVSTPILMAGLTSTMLFQQMQHNTVMKMETGTETILKEQLQTVVQKSLASHLKSAMAAQIQMVMDGKTDSIPLLTIHASGLIQMVMDMQIKQEQTYLMIVQPSLVLLPMMYADASTRMVMVGLMNLINIQTILRSILPQKILATIRLFY